MANSAPRPTSTASTCSNATYYEFGRDHWVFARQTRYGQERSFGDGEEELIPLPERLYAGGATSHRGFPINAAGPRDPQTGYPVGGAGVFVNSSSCAPRLPPCAWVGTDLSFVLFHDMGNAFREVLPDLAQLHCVSSSPTAIPAAMSRCPTPPTTLRTTCDFNDFSHALGLGLRYHTPDWAGPRRFQLQPESADLSGLLRLHHSLPQLPIRTWARPATSTSSSVSDRVSDVETAENKVVVSGISREI